jgi:hypothetical protein
MRSNQANKNKIIIKNLNTPIFFKAINKKIKRIIFELPELNFKLILKGSDEK